MDLSEQKSTGGGPKAEGENTTMFFVIEEAKETILKFSQGTARVL